MPPHYHLHAAISGYISVTQSNIQGHKNAFRLHHTVVYRPHTRLNIESRFFNLTERLQSPVNQFHSFIFFF